MFSFGCTSTSVPSLNLYMNVISKATTSEFSDTVSSSSEIWPLISSNLVVDTIGLMFAYVPSGKVPVGASIFTDTLLYLSAFVIGSTLSFSHAVTNSRAAHVSSSTFCSSFWASSEESCVSSSFTSHVKLCSKLSSSSPGKGEEAESPTPSWKR